MSSGGAEPSTQTPERILFVAVKFTIVGRVVVTG
jgi:hypothetical protein